MLGEVNVNLRTRKKKRDTSNGNGRDEWEFVSIRTMAKETLGEWGGNLATVSGDLNSESTEQVTAKPSPACSLLIENAITDGTQELADNA